MLKKMKIIKLSILRVILTAFVVVYHTFIIYTTYDKSIMGGYIEEYEILERVINNLTMPIFAAVAGFLYRMQMISGRYEKVSSLLWSKTKRLLIPYFFWSFLIAFLTQKPMLIVNAGSHLWFLVMLFWLFLLCYPLKRLKTLQLALLVILAMYLRLNVDAKIAFLGLNMLIPMMPYFIIGMLCFDLNKITYSNKTMTNLFKGFLFFIHFIIVYLWVKKVDLVFSHFSYYSLWSIVLAFYVVILLGTILKYPSSLTYNGYIEKFDNNSIGIYIIHPIIISCLYKIPTLIIVAQSNPIISPILISIIVFIISYKLSNFFRLHLANSKWRFVLG